MDSIKRGEDTEYKLEEEPWFKSVLQDIETFNKRLDEKIEKEQQKRKEIKKNADLEIKIAQEITLNTELRNQLAELTHRGTELDKACATMKNGLRISDNDQKRLDDAKENYQVAKELTGVRWDFSAPPGVAKGYIKSHARKLLQPFELPGTDVEGIWSQIQSTGSPDWPTLDDKENVQKNPKVEIVSPIQSNAGPGNPTPHNKKNVQKNPKVEIVSPIQSNAGQSNAGPGNPTPHNKKNVQKNPKVEIVSPIQPNAGQSNAGPGNPTPHNKENVQKNPKVESMSLILKTKNPKARKGRKMNK